MMLISHLLGWFSRPDRCDALDGRSEVVAPRLPFCHAHHPRAAVPAVQVTVSPTIDDMVIRIKGEAGVECAVGLEKGLLGPAARRPAVVILDLSELSSISCLAMGVLVAYRRGVVRSGGRVRLAEELQPAVREALTRAELLSLFEPSTKFEPQSDRPADPAPGLQFSPPT
jgi:anti-anti-sigma factor